MEWKRIGVATILAGTAATAISVELFGGNHARTRPSCRDGIPCEVYQYGPRSPVETIVSRTALLLPVNTTGMTVEATRPEFQLRNEERETLRRGPADRAEIERRSSEALRWIEDGRARDIREDHRRFEILPPPLGSNVPLHVDDRQVFTDLVTRPAPYDARRKTIQLYQIDQPRLQIDHCSISQVALQLHEDGQWVLSLRADQNPRPPEGTPAPFNPRLHIKRNEFVVRLRCLGAALNEPAANGIGAGKPVLVALTPCAFWVENGQPRWVRTGASSDEVRTYLSRIDRVEVEFFYH